MVGPFWCLENIRLEFSFKRKWLNPESWYGCGILHLSLLNRSNQVRRFENMSTACWCQMRRHWGGSKGLHKWEEDILRVELRSGVLQPLLEVYPLPFQLFFFFFALMSSTQHGFIIFWFFEAQHYETFMPFCHFRARSASSTCRRNHLKPSWWWALFCRDLKHLRKHCLSITKGIHCLNSVVHHSASQIVTPPLLLPEQLYPSRSSHPTVLLPPVLLHLWRLVLGFRIQRKCHCSSVWDVRTGGEVCHPWFYSPLCGNNGIWSVCTFRGGLSMSQRWISQMLSKCKNKTLINISCNLFSSLAVKINLREHTLRKRYLKSKNNVLWGFFFLLFFVLFEGSQPTHFTLVGQPACGRGERFSRKKIRFENVFLSSRLTRLIMCSSVNQNGCVPTREYYTIIDHKHLWISVAIMDTFIYVNHNQEWRLYSKMYEALKSLIISCWMLFIYNVTGTSHQWETVLRNIEKLGRKTAGNPSNVCVYIR